MGKVDYQKFLNKNATQQEKENGSEHVHQEDAKLKTSVKDFVLFNLKKINI
jgi:hypothetical protein